MEDFRGSGSPADMGLFEMPTGILVYKHTFGGATYVCAARAGDRGWTLISHLVETNANTTTVLQAALNAVDATLGNCVYIRRDIYTINNTLTAPNEYTGVVGESTSFLRNTVIRAGLDFPGATDMLIVSGSFFYMEHVCLDGRDNTVTRYLLVLNAADNQVISCFFNSGQYGIYPGMHTWIENNWIENCRSYGVHLDLGQFVWIVGNMFYNLSPCVGVWVRGGTGTGREAVWICFNRFYDEASSVRQDDTADALICVGNYHYSISSVCYYITGTVNYFEVIGDVCEGAGDTANFIYIEVGAVVNDGYVRLYRVANLTGAILVNNGIFNIRYATLTLPFVDGTASVTADGAPKGWRVAASAEFAITYGVMPPECRQTVQIKVWAVGLAAPGAGNQMLIDLVANGAQPDEVYTGEAIAVNSKESNETAFAVNDIVTWTFTPTDDADIGDLVAGDCLEIKMIYRAAVAPDIATNALLRCVEIQYI